MSFLICGIAIAHATRATRQDAASIRHPAAKPPNPFEPAHPGIGAGRLVSTVVLGELPERPGNRRTTMLTRIRDLMTPAPISLPVTAPMRTAATMMRDAAIGDVLVVDGDRLIGIVTDRDLVTRGLAQGADPDTTPVADVATSAPVTVALDDDPRVAVHLMRKHGIRRIPVIADGTPVGVITLGDLAVDRDSSSALADISVQTPNN
jgi:CBS domain-containing protein